MGQGLTHINEAGEASMVDVGAKAVTERVARARAVVRMRPATLREVVEGNAPKGDVLAVARVAGIQAAKRTSELIPLCHPLPLTKVAVDFESLATMPWRLPRSARFPGALVSRWKR